MQATAASAWSPQEALSGAVAQAQGPLLRGLPCPQGKGKPQCPAVLASSARSDGSDMDEP